MGAALCRLRRSLSWRMGFGPERPEDAPASPEDAPASPGSGGGHDAVGGESEGGPEGESGGGGPSQQGRRAAERSRVSEATIAEVVEAFMRDNTVNSPLLPDFVERALYRNVVRLLLTSAAALVDSVDVTVLGHQLSLRLQPPVGHDVRSAV